MKKILYVIAALLLMCGSCNDRDNKELTNAATESMWGYVQDSIYQDPDSVAASNKTAQQNAKYLKEYLENR